MEKKHYLTIIDHTGADCESDWVTHSDHVKAMQANLDWLVSRDANVVSAFWADEDGNRIGLNELQICELNVEIEENIQEARAEWLNQQQHTGGR